MLGHERIRRSVQPKSTYRGGKAKEVTLNLHLENEPSGCVIWMMLTRTPLSLVLSCGSADLQARPWLSSMVRSAGIRRATATESRPSGRTRASFPGAGFGGLRRSRRSQQRCSGGLALSPQLRAAKPLTVPFSCGTCGRTPDHSRSPTMAITNGSSGRGAGNSPPCPRSSLSSLQLLRAPHRWVSAGPQEGFGDLQDFYWTILAEAERTGTWSGTALELWMALFAANRAIRLGGMSRGANTGASWMNSAIP